MFYIYILNVYYSLIGGFCKSPDEWVITEQACRDERLSIVSFFFPYLTIYLYMYIFMYTAKLDTYL